MRINLNRLSSNVLIAGSLLFSLGSLPSFAAELITSSSLGYYNNNLGDLYPGNTSDPLAAYFTGPNISTGAPTADFSIEPDLGEVSELGDWLDDPESALENGFWSELQSIPTTWDVNTETAIIYEIDGGETGFNNVTADFVIDNSILVWVNGEYEFGIGNPPGFRANGVDLGNLNPGKNYIQILRADYGITTNYQVEISGVANDVIDPPQPPIDPPSQPIPPDNEINVPEPSSVATLLALAVFGTSIILKQKAKQSIKGTSLY